MNYKKIIYMFLFTFLYVYINAKELNKIPANDIFKWLKITNSIYPSDFNPIFTDKEIVDKLIVWPFNNFKRLQEKDIKKLDKKIDPRVLLFIDPKYIKELRPSLRMKLRLLEKENIINIEKEFSDFLIMSNEEIKEIDVKKLNNLFLNIKQINPSIKDNFLSKLYLIEAKTFNLLDYDIACNIHWEILSFLTPDQIDFLPENLKNKLNVINDEKKISLEYIYPNINFLLKMNSFDFK